MPLFGIIRSNGIFCAARIPSGKQMETEKAGRVHWKWANWTVCDASIRLLWSAVTGHRFGTGQYVAQFQSGDVSAHCSKVNRCAAVEPEKTIHPGLKPAAGMADVKFKIRLAGRRAIC
jgi:hypothetical protein